MKKQIKKFLTLVMMLGIIGGGILYWRSDSSAKMTSSPSVSMAKVQIGSILQSVAASGNVEANFEVVAKIKASGIVEELPYDYGDLVKKNDLLLKLDPQDEEYNVKQAEIALTVAQIKVKQTRQKFLIAQKDIQTIRKRAIATLETAKITDSESRKSEKTELQQAMIQVNASEEKLNKAQQDYVIAQNQYVADKKSAEVKLEEAIFKRASAKTNTNRIKALFENDIINESEYETARDELVQAEYDYKTTKLVLDALKIQEMSIQLKHKDVQVAETQVNLDKSALERLQNTETTSMDLINASIDVEELTSREMSLKELEQDVQLAEEQVKLESLALLEAKDQLEDTVLHAPFDGIIVERYVQLMEQLNVNNDSEIEILTVADISKLYVTASVDESDIGQVDIGQKVDVTLDAYPDRKFKAVVDRISAKGVSSSSVVTFDVKILIQVDDTNLLKPGMTADVEIIISEANEVVVVPTDSIFRKRQKQLVMVAAENGLKEERSIITGASDGVNTAVLEGLSEGETVYLNVAASGSKWSKTDQKDASLIPVNTGQGRGKGGPGGKH